MRPVLIVETDIRGDEQRVVYTAPPPIQPLPALFDGHVVRTRWQPTEAEREAIARGAYLDVEVTTFGNPPQPIWIGVQGVDS